MPILDEDMLKSAKAGKLRAGRNPLIKYLSGGKIFRTDAVKAKCYDCNGMGESKECDIISCSLYPYSPYRIKKDRLLKRALGGVRRGKKGIVGEVSNA